MFTTVSTNSSYNDELSRHYFARVIRCEPSGEFVEAQHTIVSLENRKGNFTIVLDGHHNVPCDTLLKITLYPDWDGDVILVQISNPDKSLGRILTDRRHLPGKATSFRALEQWGDRDFWIVWEGTDPTSLGLNQVLPLSERQFPDSSGVLWFEAFKSGVWVPCVDPRLLTAAKVRMKLGYSTQFYSPAVIVLDPTVLAEEIIAFAYDLDAIVIADGEECVVLDIQFGKRQVGPEVYTQSSLMRSFKGI